MKLGFALPIVVDAFAMFTSLDQMLDFVGQVVARSGGRVKA